MFKFVNERDAPSVTEQPVVQVNSWRVVEAKNGNRHLAAVLDRGPLRTTSPIATFNPATAELTTTSGRKYELLGPPEARQPQLALLAANVARVGLSDSVDISDTLWQSIEGARLTVVGK